MAGIIRVIEIDRGWIRIQKASAQLNGRQLRVGFPADIVSQDGTPVAEYAAYNEFGTEQIPARPFLRRTIDESRSGFGQYVRRTIDTLLFSGLGTKEFAMDLLGNWMVARVRRTIQNSPSWAQPNAPSTVARKEGDHPLIDTGLMLRSVTFRKSRR